MLAQFRLADFRVTDTTSKRSWAATASAWEDLEAAQIMAGERFSHNLLYEAMWQGTPETVSAAGGRALMGKGSDPRGGYLV
ncbi:hypothetical protein GCM10008949_16300 [Deinococcus humi]|nr:hypothetical protein GCM10008949_16300 [Deinococcus humi]